MASIARMYQSQMPAYQQFDTYKPKKTNSTPESPPKFTPANLDTASIAKWKAIENMPTKCPHCNVILDPSTCYDEYNGNVMIYCRIKDACGKSHVRFAQPDLKIPIYEQVCVFKAKGDNDNNAIIKVSIDNNDDEKEKVNTNNNDGQNMEQQIKFIKQQEEPKQIINPNGQGIPFMQQQQQQQIPMKGVFLQQAMPSFMNEKCVKCGIEYNEHKHDYDENGWRIKGYEKQQLPKGWPVYKGNGKWEKKNF